MEARELLSEFGVRSKSVLSIATSAFVEHQTASGQDILAAIPESLRLVVPGACTCCDGSSSCSCCG
jgi:hypothetical protein